MVRLRGLSFWWADGIHARNFGLEWFGNRLGRMSLGDSLLLKRL